MKLHQNDPSLVSLFIDCPGVGRDEITRLTEALAVNSILSKLNFYSKRFTKVVSTQLVQALKVNYTLTRLTLESNHITDS